MSDNSQNQSEEKLEAIAKIRMLKTSPQKLNLVSKMIRNKPVNVALAQLKFSRKRIALDVKKCLESAVANAENNHDLDIEELIVSEAFDGKNLVLKRHEKIVRSSLLKMLYRLTMNKILTKLSIRWIVH